MFSGPQEQATGRRQQQQSDCQQRLEVHASRLTATLLAEVDDRHHATGHEQEDAAAQRGELPPVAVHAQLDELVILDGHLVGGVVAHLLGDGQLLRADREVPIGYGGFLHPNVTEGHTVQGDLSHTVHHKLGHIALGIVEVGAVAVLDECESFKAVVRLDLDLKARTHERVAGTGVDLLDLHAGGPVLHSHHLRVADAIPVRQDDADLVLRDVAGGRDLDQLVFPGREVAELHMAVIAHMEEVLTVLGPDAVVVVVGHDDAAKASNFPDLIHQDGADHLVVHVPKLELDQGERLAGEQIHLVDLEADGLIRNLGGAGHMAVVVHHELEGTGVDGEPFGGLGLGVGVPSCGQLHQDDLAVEIGLLVEHHLAGSVLDLDGRAVHGLAGGQIGLFEDDLVGHIGSLEHQGGLVVGGQLDFDDLVRQDEPGRGHDLTDVVGADRQIAGNGVSGTVRGNGAIEQPVGVPHLILCAFQHPALLEVVTLPDGDVAHKAVVPDGLIRILLVVALYGQRIGFLGHMDGVVRELQLSQVILAEGQRGAGNGHTACVRGQNVHQGVLGDDPDGLGGVQTEHGPFQRTGLEFHGLLVEVIGLLDDLHRGGNPVVDCGDLAVDDRRILVLIGQRDRLDGRVELIPGRGLGLLHGIGPKREQAGLRDAVRVRGDRGDHRGGLILYGELATVEAAVLILGRMELAVFRGGGGGTHQGFAGLLHPDNALGRLVLDLQRRGFAGPDDDGIHHAVNDIRADGVQLLHIVGAAVHVVQEHRAVRAGGDFGDLGCTGRVRIDAELDPGQRCIGIAVLLDLKLAGSGGVDAEGSGGHDLSGVGAEKDLLEAVVGGNVRRHVLQSAGVLAGCRDGEGLARCGQWRGDRQGLALPSREAGEGHAGGQAGGIQGVPGVDVGQIDRGGAAVAGAGPVQGQGGRRELDGVTQGFLIPGHLEQLIRPFEDMFVSQLGTDLIGMGTAVGERIAAGFAVFTEPEPDRVGRRLSRFVLREAIRCVAGIAVHEDGLKTGQRVRSKHGGRRRGGIRRAVGVAGGMLDTVADLAGGFDPVAGRIQILPATAAVILQVVKGVVTLRLDRYILRERAIRMGGTHGCEGEQADQAQGEGQDTGDSSLHLFFLSHIKLLPVKSRKLLLVQANAESAFAGYGVISLTTTARIVLDVSRCLVEVGDLLHEVFIEHVLSCGKKHGSLRFRQGNGSPSGSKVRRTFTWFAVIRRNSFHTSGIAAKARIISGIWMLYD